MRQGKVGMKRIKPISVIIPLFVLIIVGSIYFTSLVSNVREEIIITMPYNAYIRNIDTNYYKEWLEEQTGLTIKFNIVKETHSADYLRSMFASGYVKSDAFFSILSDDDWHEWNAVLQEFGEKGYILPLNDYIDNSVYLNAIFEEFADYDLHSVMTSANGNIYYMPGFDFSISESHFQVLWLNQDWLKTLNLTIPQTTDELRNVLYAFKAGDPNGNGKQDEIPLAGSRDVPSEQVYNAIINAFIYNDPVNSRLFIEDGIVRFAPQTSKWREAMKYLNGLYADGLIEPFKYEHTGLVRLANDPLNMLGGFASCSVTDVLFRSNPEIINDFVHIAPLIGHDGTRNTTVKTPLPKPSGIITANCKNPEAVFRLFDLMLSEEAFLIGRYGEENVDWVRAHITDRDIYGNNAAVKVINQLRDGVQNKHINEIAPFFAYPKYADSVTFPAFEANYEYVNARAYRIYEPYKPKEYITPILFKGKSDIQTLRQSIDDYTDESIEAFITGTADPFNDNDWEEHLQEYRVLGVDKLINAAMEIMP
jgi:putative aldouronate transport system substrate-binding protein